MALASFLTVSAEEITLLNKNIQNVTALVESQELKMNITTGPVSYDSMKLFTLNVGGCTAKIEAQVNAQDQLQYNIAVADKDESIINPSNIVATPTGIEFSSVDNSVSLPCNVDFEQIDCSGNYKVELGLSGGVPPNLTLSSSSSTIYESGINSNSDVSSSATIYESDISDLEIALIVAGVFGALITLVVVVFAVICCRRRRKSQIEEDKDTLDTNSKLLTPARRPGKGLDKKRRTKSKVTASKKSASRPKLLKPAENKSAEVIKTEGGVRKAANPVDDEALSSNESEQVRVPTQMTQLTTQETQNTKISMNSTQDDQ